MPKRRNHLPSYRLHKASGQAVVTVSGRDVYLGPHGSEVSRQEYDRIIAEWLANGRRLSATTPGGQPSVSIVELIADYWRHAQVYYCKHGRPTTEQHNIGLAMRWLKKLYGRTDAADFGPVQLRAIQEAMIADGLSRVYINDHTGRIKRCFKWAAAHGLVLPAVFHGLEVVGGLQRGRTTARERVPVRPVSDVLVDGIRAHVSRQVWAMIELQRLTGMRPGEAITMRGADLDMSGKLWLYTPAEHKTEHHDNRPREVYLGPQAQKIVSEFLKPDLAAPLFSPREAETERYAKAETHRRPNQKRNQRKTARAVGDRYGVSGYGRAIKRACDLAYPPPGPLARQEGESVRGRLRRLTDEEKRELIAWQKEHRFHPHQLRHNAATRLRKEFGIEAARVVLGHASASVTEIYAEIDSAKAADVMSRIG